MLTWPINELIGISLALQQALIDKVLEISLEGSARQPKANRFKNLNGETAVIHDIRQSLLLTRIEGMLLGDRRYDEFRA